MHKEVRKLRIFVTGGAGFIGFNLVKSLLEKNHEVIVFDNFNKGNSKMYSNFSNDNISIVTGDIKNYDNISNSMKNIDLVIHLAAKINVVESIQYPSEYFQTNVIGTENVLHACVENNVDQFIAASSAAVYGIPENLPLDENYPLKSISPYGQTKVDMENKIKEYSKNYKLNSIILRFFNVFGPGQSLEYAGVITKFLQCIKNDEPLVIFGDGSYTRDFIYISDVVDSFLKSIENIIGKCGKCFNVASGTSTSITKLANLMLDISNKKLEIRYVSPKNGDIPHSQANIQLAKKELNFMPKISLDEGLSSFFI